MDFLDFILDLMEWIVDLLRNMGEILTTIAFGFFGILVMVLLLVSAPVWIVPYLIWKKRKETIDDNLDDDFDAYTSATR